MNLPLLLLLHLLSDHLLIVFVLLLLDQHGAFVADAHVPAGHDYGVNDQALAHDALLAEALMHLLVCQAAVLDAVNFVNHKRSISVALATLNPFTWYFCWTSFSFPWPWPCHSMS